MSISEQAGINLNAALQERTVLYVSYYRCNSDARQKELNFCLEKNAECEDIDTILIICENGIKPNFHNSKFTYATAQRRLTYRDIFDYAKMMNADGWNIFINSDIFLIPESVRQIKERIAKYSKTFIALTRWDLDKDHPDLSATIRMRVGPDSQDTWAWFGIVPDSVQADFAYGIPGCDNAIAERLSKYYEVINPSLTIQTFHVHKSGERTYNSKKDRIQPPYKILTITK